MDNLNDPSQWKVAHESDPSNPPEELKDLERDYVDSISTPSHLEDRSGFTDPKTNLFMATSVRRSYKAMRKYRVHKK